MRLGRLSKSQVERRMKKIGLLPVVLLIAATSSFAQDVRYNFDKNADFNKFKTYRWVPIKDAQPINDIVAKQITSSI